MFLDNGYPSTFFSNTLEKFRRKLSNQINVSVATANEESDIVGQDSQDKKWRFVLKVPFVGPASYKFQNQMTALLKSTLDVDVRPVFTSFKTSTYFSLKCPTPFPYKSNVVYQFTCLSDQTVSYIGETTRHLKTRVNEHLKTHKEKSQVWVHVQKCPTCKHADLSVKHFKILKSCRGWMETAISESIFINSIQPTLNKKIGTEGKVIRLHAFSR